MLFGMCSFLSRSQVYETIDFSNGIPPNWTSTYFYHTSSSITSCDGHSAASYDQQSYLTSPLYTTAGNAIQVSFDYKLVNYMTAVTGNFGQMTLEHSIDGGATWAVDILIDENNHVPSTTCASVVATTSAADVGTGGYIVYRFNMSKTQGFYFDAIIDNIQIIELTSCPFPIDIVEIGNTGATSTVTWTPLGLETEWEVEYGSAGFTPGAGTSLIVANDTTTISGLAADSFFDVYVHAICGPGDTSLAIAPITINTYSFGDYLEADEACSPIGYYDISGTGAPHVLGDDAEIGIGMPFPFLFQGTTVSEMTLGSNGGVVLNTLYGSVSTGGNIGNSGTPVGLYPFWDDLQSTQHPMYTQVVGSAPSRVFIVQWEKRGHYSSIAGQEVSFQLQMHEGTNEIYFMYDDVVFGGSQSQYDYGISADIGVKGYNNDVEISNSNANYLMNNSCAHIFYTDCARPANFQLFASSNDSLAFTWNSYGDNVSGWTIIYGPEGFDPGTSGTTINNSTDTLILNGLLGGTTFDIYIYSDCFPSSQSTPLFAQATTHSNCSTPTNFYATDVEDSVFLSWNWTEASGIGAFPSTGFIFEYGPDNFTPGTGTSIALDNNFTDTIANVLLAGHVYEVYLQAVCGTDTSDYTYSWYIQMPGVPDHDTACYAYPLTVGGQLETFTNEYAGVEPFEQLIAPPATGAQTTDGWETQQLHRTMWHTFVAPSSGNLQIEAVNGGGKVAVYEVVDCADFSTYQLIGANDDNLYSNSSSRPNFTLCGLTPGTTYYLVYSSEQTWWNNYALQLTELALSAGTAGATVELCAGEVVQLNTIISGQDVGGSWTDVATGNTVPATFVAPNPAVNETLQFEYSVSFGCAHDSVLQEVQVYAMPSAGDDGSTYRLPESTGESILRTVRNS